MLVEIKTTKTKTIEVNFPFYGKDKTHFYYFNKDSWMSVYPTGVSSILGGKDLSEDFLKKQFHEGITEITSDEFEAAFKKALDCIGSVLGLEEFPADNPLRPV